MAYKILSVRVDEQLKSDFDDFCADVGTNASMMVNMFMRTVTREQRVPFEIMSGKRFAASGNDGIAAKQKAAVKEFIRNVNAAADEPLGSDFDEILNQRINITRVLDI